MEKRRLRFSVYERFTLVVERAKDGWLVLEVGAEGKRRLRPDLALPPGLKEADVARYLDDLLHEHARPGTSIRLLAFRGRVTG